MGASRTSTCPTRLPVDTLISTGTFSLKSVRRRPSWTNVSTAAVALATDIIEYLKRPLMSLVATRDGADESQPQGAIFGPKVMIINEFAGSGGDAMPWYFHRAGVGKLIGKRTWGGLVGRAVAPELMDGGFATAPSSGVWNPNGEWEVENHGIDPGY